VIVKALGAYMRSAPVLDLPADLRRLRNFHQKMLMAHADEVVSLLDDETSRGLVLQWLDDSPSLPKKQEQALRTAAAREDGWEDALAEMAGPAERADPATGLRDALQRESEKTAAAKDEARRVKESSRKSLDDARSANKELRKELEDARREAAARAAEAAEARAEAERAAASADKLERRARKDATAAEERAREATQQLRAVRKELNAARRRIAELEASLEKAAAQRKAPARRAAKEPERGPRRPLPVPKGRLADDPLTLDAWLDAPGVHLLVDGYNVTKSPGGYPDLDLPSQRERLIEQLERLALKKNAPTTVVFDGSDVPPGRSRLARTRVRVEYSRPGEIADDHLIAKLASLPPDPVVLVTGDRELQERAGAEGATIAVAAQLLELAR
jgi:predicted RNA-binding protein with PIN domain